MPASLSDEVTYLSGIGSNGKIGATSFRTWNTDSAPATYGSSSLVAKWGSATVGTAGGTVSYYFDPASNWTATEKAAFTSVLDLWSAIANISFSQSASAPAHGITITRGNGGAYEQGSFSGSSGAGAVGGTQTWSYNGGGSTVSIDTSESGFGPIDGSFSTAGGYPWTTMLHEIGHAIGLGHGGPYNEGDGIDPSTHQYSVYDSRLYSIMSYVDPDDTSATYYNQYPVTGTNWGSVLNAPYIWSNSPTTWMPLDILALQRLYGAPVSTPLSGGQTFGFNAAGFNGTAGQAIESFFDFTRNTDPVVTIWDAGTGNTLDLSGFSSASTVNLNPGTYSSAGTALSGNGSTTISMVNNIAIAYDTAIDTIITGSGNDVITGNNDGDIFHAGAGSNTLYGGAGIDTAVMSGAHNAYTILHNANGSVTVAKAGESDILWDFEKVAFADETVSLKTARNDFNGDSTSDILFQNADTGQASIWFMDGTTRLAGSGSAGKTPGANVKAIASGDFNGDGDADILWQNTATGQASIWLMDGTSRLAGSGNAGSAPGATLKVIGTGDFNDDGKSDILWQNTATGQVSIWLMDGTGRLAGSGAAGTSPGADWKIAGIGDFNGDGHSDLVWQDTGTGQVSIWLMNGTTKLAGSATVASSALGAAWSVVGVGDFNDDGDADLLWKNSSTGQVSVWLMNGTTRTGGGAAGSLASVWQAAGTGDYNGDGDTDIAWQNSSNGQVALWMMNGATRLGSSGGVSPTPNSVWHVVAG